MGFWNWPWNECERTHLESVSVADLKQPEAPKVHTGAYEEHRFCKSCGEHIPDVQAKECCFQGSVIKPLCYVCGSCEIESAIARQHYVRIPYGGREILMWEKKPA